MKRPILCFAALLFSAATLASAHQGVTNAGVMARMDGMLSAQKATKVLINMAAGKRGFDSAQAGAAKAAIVGDLGAVPTLFAKPHSDPKSEARPIIWDNFEDFLARNDKAIAAMQAVEVGSLDGLRASLPAAGAACLDCHQTYRVMDEKKGH